MPRPVTARQSVGALNAKPRLPASSTTASAKGCSLARSRLAAMRSRSSFSATGPPGVGTISTSLASVLEYSFRKSGRPDAYVLGQEGGGAFLAGVRYGSGTLFMRSGGTGKIYWHGPSIGTDFGAAGSRTMFLIYNLKEPSELMRGFTGVDGSAYFVGGVGILRNPLTPIRLPNIGESSQPGGKVVGPQMTVGVHRHRESAMPHQGLSDDRRHARLNEPGRMCMP